jgi:hypothetical protein
MHNAEMAFIKLLESVSITIKKTVNGSLIGFDYSSSKHLVYQCS